VRKSPPAVRLSISAALAALLVSAAIAGASGAAVVAGARSPISPAASGARHPATTAPAAAKASAAGAPAIGATVTLSGRGRPVPPAFFGLSMEYNELPTFEHQGAVFDRALSLIRPRDGGPMLLKLGGKSADHALWEPKPTTSPGAKPGTHAAIAGSRAPVARASNWSHGVYTFDQSWLDGLSALVRQENLRVILDLNLAVHSTTMETRFLKAAVQALPRHGLDAVDVGNEPNQYHFQPSLVQVHVASSDRATPTNWWHAYSPSDYRHDFIAYARALRAADPGVTLGAPDITYPLPDWMTAVSGLGPLGPRYIAIHMYGSSICWAPTSPLWPTIPRLLYGSDMMRLQSIIGKGVAFAHEHGMQMRVTEFNSVSCGGNPGVADTFATALWAPDALFTFMKGGVSGVNMHIRPSTVNAPFHFRNGQLEPRPELYGLALFSQMTHGPATLLDSTVTTSAPLELKAWAVRKGATTSVLLLNDGTRAAAATLRTYARSRPVTVRRLTAPRAGAKSGIRFGGQWIGSDGRWHGHQVQSRASRTAQGYRVNVPPYSAALVTL
jgi:hypothetical protein